MRENRTSGTVGRAPGSRCLYPEVIEILKDVPVFTNFLRRHREVILSGAKNHAKLNSILSKFVWMANYHNQIISNLHDEAFENYDLDKEDFIITSEEIPALQYMKP